MVSANISRRLRQKLFSFCWICECSDSMFTKDYEFRADYVSY